jgi:hypothetical protein
MGITYLNNMVLASAVGAPAVTRADDNNQIGRDLQVLSAAGGYPQGRIHKPAAALAFTFADGRREIREYPTVKAMSHGAGAVQATLERFKRSVASRNGFRDQYPGYRPPSMMQLVGQQVRVDGRREIHMKPPVNSRVRVQYPDRFST